MNSILKQWMYFVSVASHGIKMTAGEDVSAMPNVQILVPPSMHGQEIIYCSALTYNCKERSKCSF